MFIWYNIDKKLGGCHPLIKPKKASCFFDGYILSDYCIRNPSEKATLIKEYSDGFDYDYGDVS